MFNELFFTIMLMGVLLVLVPIMLGVVFFQVKNLRRERKLPQGQ